MTTAQSRKRSKPARNQQEHKAQVRSHGLLVTTLVLIGLFASFLVYIRGQDTTRRSHAVQHTAGRRQHAAVTHQQSKPKYDFYQELPKRQVEVPGESPAPKTAAAKPHSTAPAAKETTAPKSGSAANNPTGRAASQQSTGAKGYVLQAGAFRLYSQADRVKARLALLGIEAHIDSGESGGSSIYRVRVGPLSDSAADKMRHRLSAKHINSIKLKND